MNNKLNHRLISLVVAMVILGSPVLAQQRRGATPRRAAPAATREPAPTLDSLLAAESYKVYCEIRGVGGLIRSAAVNDLLDPIMKLGAPPKEFKTVVKWLKVHSDVLAGSRMLVTGWPSRPNLPMFLVAIEFSSPEEAKKFYPELRDFLPTLIPTPPPAPASSPVPATNPSAMSAVESDTEVVRAELVPVRTSPEQIAGVVAQPQPTPNLPPYQMSQAGPLVLISDKAFTLRHLRPHGSKALEEDENFLLARTSFANESVFLYVDLQSIEKEEKDRQKKWEEEAQKRAEIEKANPPNIEDVTAEEMKAAQAAEAPPTPAPEIPDTSQPTVVEATAESQASSTTTLSGEPTSVMSGPRPFISLYMSLFAGESKWPEAVGAALVAEGDAYVVRTLMVNKLENKGIAIPFLPQFISGPAIAPESPGIFPADLDLFVSVSLDYSQVYEGMLKAIAHTEELSRKYRRPAVRDETPPESPFAIYEKKLGLKIKDDLLPLLGHELAFALPKKAAKPASELEAATKPIEDKPASVGPYEHNPTASPNPVIAISVKDREAVGRLIPKIIEAFGLKGANLLAQSEKRDGTEIVSYANFFSYAFIGDFLVLSPDPVQTRHVVDSYLNHQTLSSDSHFRNFTRWQPRQVLGQVYVAPDLMETYNPFGRGLRGAANARVNDYMSRLSPLIEPTTYALTNDGSGPLHELHIPRNLLLWMIGSTFGVAEGSALHSNEAVAKGLLRTVYSAEASFQATAGNGRYGTLDELIAAGLISKEAIQKYGYRIDVMPAGKKFEATAVPIEYGVSGTLSYFIDETGNLRGGDHGGGPPSVADQPIN
ncbi:MAG TPA: DUF3352 domain-containing protein [Pyrinomonadaceae bacterium]|nr:DUF3352 domain-containing protein [Pyrinomonadaceae bacterium]